MLSDPQHEADRLHRTSVPAFIGKAMRCVQRLDDRSPPTVPWLGSICLFGQCDLGELTDVDHIVGSVENLSLQSTTLQRVDDGSCFWQAPYPCYVERISFDAVALTLNGSASWLFRVVPFTFRSTATGGWTQADQLSDLVVRSWLLPGHGVALLWKPSNDYTSGM